VKYQVDVIAPPTTEPVTLGEAKEQLRIEASFTEEDSLISALISTAREYCEAFCNRFFTEQDIIIRFSGSIPAELILPFRGLSVTASSYIDDDKTEQPYPLAKLFLDPNTNTVYFDEPKSAKSYNITLTTSAPSDLSRVKDAIKMIVADMYEHRTEQTGGIKLEENKAVKARLYALRDGLGI